MSLEVCQPFFSIFSQNLEKFYANASYFFNWHLTAVILRSKHEKSNEISTILFSFLATCATIHRRNILSFQKVFKN